MLDHLAQALFGHVRAQVLHGAIEFAAERLAAQRAVKQHVAPVVAHAALPARIIREPRQAQLELAQHAIVVPIQNVPDLGVKRAVQIAVTVLRIAIARQDLKRHPIDQVLGIEVGVKHIVDLLSIVVERIEHLNQLGMVRVALNLEHALKRRLVIVGVIRQLNGVFEAMEIEAVHLIQMPALIQTVGLKCRLVELLDLRKQSVVLKGVVRLFGLVAHP